MANVKGQVTGSVTASGSGTENGNGTIRVSCILNANYNDENYTDVELVNDTKTFTGSVDSNGVWNGGKTVLYSLNEEVTDENAKIKYNISGSWDINAVKNTTYITKKSFIVRAKRIPFEYNTSGIIIIEKRSGLSYKTIYHGNFEITGSREQGENGVIKFTLTDVDSGGKIILNDVITKEAGESGEITLTIPPLDANNDDGSTEEITLKLDNKTRGEVHIIGIKAEGEDVSIRKISGNGRIRIRISTTE